MNQKRTGATAERTNKRTLLCVRKKTFRSTFCGDSISTFFDEMQKKMLNVSLLSFLFLEDTRRSDGAAAGRHMFTAATAAAAAAAAAQA